MTGAALHPFRAAGLLALAGAPAILATRRFSRLALGLLLLLDGTAVAAGVLDALRSGPARTTLWPVVAAAGALLLVAAGALILARGRGWPSMSARYERVAGAPPTRSAATPEQGMWESLDRGHDPTG